MANALKLLFLATGIAGLLPAAVTYVATDIGYPPGATRATLVQVNNNGQVCGYGTSGSYPNTVYTAFVWSPGIGMVVIGTGKPVGINDSGQVVYNNGGQIYVWNQDGSTVTVGSGSAVGINNKGQVAGAANSQAFLWDPGTGMTNLGFLSGQTWSSAQALNDQGQVIGDSGWISYLYATGTGMASIPVPVLNGINNDGIVVGHDGYDGYIWRADMGLVKLPRLPNGAFGESVAINDYGQATGVAGINASDLMGQAVVYTGNTVINLNSVTTGLPSGVTLLEGMSINNVGQIIAWAIPDYYLLTPTPITYSHCDINRDKKTNLPDGQGIVQESLGGTPPADDLNADGAVNVVDVQIVLDAALSLGCAADTPYTPASTQQMTRLAPARGTQEPGIRRLPPGAGAPHVTSVTPPDGAAEIAPQTPIVLTFDRPLHPGSVTAATLRLIAGSTPVAAAVTRSPDSRTFTLTGGLPAGETIRVVATSGVTDLAGDALADFTSSFRTAPASSDTMPRVVSMRPANGATGAASGTAITLISSAPLEASRVAGSLSVIQNGVPVSGTIAVDARGGRIQFKPDMPFLDGATVLVFLGNYSAQLTVERGGAAAAPEVVSISPLNGAVLDFLNPVIDVRFDTSIDAASVSSAAFSVMRDDGMAVHGVLSLFDPYTIRFVPDPAPLAAARRYTVNMTGALRGSNGIAFRGAADRYSFSIAETATLPDDVPPAVSGVAPADSYSVGDNASVRVTFSKPIDPLTVNAATLRIGADGLTDAPASFAFDAANQSVIVTPRTFLPDNAPITVAIDGITDVAGNAVPSAAARFTTLAGPEVSVPAVVSTSAASDGTIVLRFSRAMDSRTLSGRNLYLYDCDSQAYIPVTYRYGADGLTAAMTPAAPPALGHSLEIGVRNAQDMAGNVIEAFAARFPSSVR